MPVQDPFQLPDSAQDLPLTKDPNATYFLMFIASISPDTKQPWCPDVRAALPIVGATFSAGDAPEIGYVHVGQKPEYVHVRVPRLISAGQADEYVVIGGEICQMYLEQSGTSRPCRRWSDISALTVR